MARPGWAWVALTALLALGSLLLAPTPLGPALDWRPELAWQQPWRWWTAALVHGSGLHLGVNLAGAAVLAVLGLAARLGTSMALAWALAWPLTQLGLLARPDLMRFAGMSGVLHAGVAIAALFLGLRGQGVRRLIGWAIGIGLAVKVVSEAPWGPVLRHAPGWDIAVAPWSHASGALAGLICAGLVLAFARPPTGASSPPGPSAA